MVMKLSGILTIDELNQLKRNAAEDERLNAGCNMLVDIRYADVQISPEDLVAHETWISTHPLYSKVEKFAILTLSPEHVEVSFEFIQNAGLRIDHYMIFQTICNAMEWLEIEQKSEMLELYLESEEQRGKTKEERH